MTTKKNLQIHQMTLSQFDALFPDETACRKYLAVNRWQDGVVRCPRCGTDKVHELTRAEHWQCKQCSPNGYRFSVLVGTIFENTNKPLRQWFQVMHMMLTSKKGISAMQIYRVMGFGSYNTAHMMCTKIRIALGNVEFKQLMGVVEIDETFVGGKAKNRHRSKDDDDGRGTGRKDKFIVAGAVERKGNVIAKVVANTRTDTLNAFVRYAVSTKVSLIATDEAPAYQHLSYHGLPHGFVCHARKQYVHGAIHTNTIEGFWSIFKRGIVGTFHKVSKQYLPLYVNEFEFRYNNRMNPDIFGTAIRAC